MTNHTGNVTFHSKSNKVGSARWLVEQPPVLPRGYLLDLGFMNLPERWFLIGLVADVSGFSLRVHGCGSAAEASLDEADIAAALATPAIINVAVNSSDGTVAIERMERAVSNVMHGLLAPLAAVDFIWQRFATTDGTGAYAPKSA